MCAPEHQRCMCNHEHQWCMQSKWCNENLIEGREVGYQINGALEAAAAAAAAPNLKTTARILSVRTSEFRSVSATSLLLSPRCCNGNPQPVLLIFRLNTCLHRLHYPHFISLHFCTLFLSSVANNDFASDSAHFIQFLKF